MSKYDHLKLPIARKEVEIVFRCYGPEGMFVRNYEDMPQELQDAFNGELSIPCEGGGRLGPWCENCLFGEVEEW